ncbi:MAG: mechanosensitive ion channel family protein [Bryobacteraceae bacterium]
MNRRFCRFIELLVAGTGRRQRNGDDWRDSTLALGIQGPPDIRTLNDSPCDRTKVNRMTTGWLRTCMLLTAVLVSEYVWAQAVTPAAPKPAAEAETPRDPLGRTTPRGTVRGFLTAEGKGDKDTAISYLNTTNHAQAVRLAHQLFVVLNRRSRVQLNDINDQPEGSLSPSTEPEKELIGTISADTGDIDIVIERVNRKNGGPIWLFSRKTLSAVPEIYDEVTAETTQNWLMKFLLETKIAHISLLHWLAVFVGLPLLHYAGVVLNRVLSRSMGRLMRALSKNPVLPNPEVLSGPVRLLLFALLVRWAISGTSLPLLAMEYWSGIAFTAAVVACVWFLLRLSRWAERKIHLRLGRRNQTGALSVLRFARSALDATFIFLGLLVLLHYFDIKATTALAGLGVGGIAVALAAQKTLENVIAGVSLISDKALSVGDFLKVGNTMGTVTDIGLRSTRIRTLDRTMVNVPNGQIANATLENFSQRDRFWFHHFLALICETSSAQTRGILTGLTEVVSHRPEVYEKTDYVRLLRFGSSSFDVEIFAYVAAANWPDFLRIQEQLLLDIIEVVERAGARVALPSQIMYVNAHSPRDASVAPASKDSPRGMEFASQG